MFLSINLNYSLSVAPVLSRLWLVHARRHLSFPQPVDVTMLFGPARRADAPVLHHDVQGRTNVAGAMDGVSDLPAYWRNMRANPL